MTVKIQITASNHTHKGDLVPVGAVLEVDEATAEWLTENKVGVLFEGPVKKTLPSFKSIFKSKGD